MRGKRVELKPWAGKASLKPPRILLKKPPTEDPAPEAGRHPRARSSHRRSEECSDASSDTQEESVDEERTASHQSPARDQTKSPSPASRSSSALPTDDEDETQEP